MSDSKGCYHRFSVYEESVGFTSNDGVDVFFAGARFLQCNTCSHTEIPLDSSDTIESSQFEKRNNLFSPKNLYVNVMQL